MKNKKVALFLEQPSDDNYTPKITLGEVLMMILVFAMFLGMIIAFFGRFFYLW